MPKKKNKNKNKNMAKAKNDQAVVVANRPSRGGGRSVLSATPFADTGRYLGRGIGGFLGGAAGSLLGKIFGMGAYTVKSNTLMSVLNGGPPSFGNTDGSITVKRREYVTDVIGAGGAAFSLNLSYYINPSNSALFPFLSQLSQNFEEYEFKGLIFEFNTTSGSVTTSQSLGTIIMSTNYDPLDANFGSKQEMEGYMFTTSVVPCNSCIHPVECAPKDATAKNLFVVPQTGLPANADLRLYHKGTFQLANAGVPANTSIGELWVSYDVVLRVPKVNPINLVHPAHAYNATGTATTAAPLNNGLWSGNSVISSANPQYILSTTGVTITIPGYYLVYYQVVTAASDIAGVTTTNGGSNVIGPNNVQDFSNNPSAAVNYSTTVATVTTVIQVTAPGTAAANKITIGGMTGLTAGYFDFFIIPIPTVTATALGF
jgi:hypothetical protein